ncbi:hypothetical protein SPSIL_017840 [Sporomusa silvacetica DSM 10669]|uniref:Biotin transporter BioY n=1 Tax=Sporomusa silvacetica DSM 10669 TaxID=1123289 RepID=A0ABZ3IIZ8_9FIRM|nr:hypothetical protein [Sporomusa silvacetica]OZC18437.1 hypothetical protein SPSIL_26370 [Sporomusa silvacetica DSM 10669]
MQSRVSWVAEVGLLAAFITITSTFKLPGVMPGTEFQLSAPLATAICVVFGFGKYITAGLLSSVVGLMLGTQSLLNVFIAMVFRVTVGLLVVLLGRSWPVIVLAGPIGSAIGRLVLGGIIGKAVIPLLLAALPGMIYTALLTCPVTALLQRVKEQREKVMRHVVQR